MSLILNVAHRFHFAFALTITMGGFVAAILSAEAGVPAPLAVLVAVVVSGVVGAAIEILIYRPLARRSGEAALLPIFVSALGLTIGGQSLIQLAWARNTTNRPFSLMPTERLPMPFELRFTTLDLTTLVVFGGLAAIVIVVLRFTRAGHVIRGVRGNPLMATVGGIGPETVYVWIFVFASAASGLAGAFIAARFSATPGMGFDPMFTAFVVAFLAGSAAPALRVVIIGVALGVVQSISSLWIPSNLTNIVVFGLLFAYLVARGVGGRLPRPIRRTREA
jgi:branched-subunit amino acid ABC-type transport system permease component